MINFSKRTIILLGISAALASMSGCTAFADKQLKKEKIAVSEDKDLIAKQIDKRIEPRPYVGGRLITRKKPDEMALPESLNEMITIADSTPIGLSQIGQRLNLITKIPVNIAQDLVAAELEAKRAGMNSLAASSTVPFSAQPAPAAPSTTGGTTTFYLPRIPVSFTGTTTEFLNMISSRMGISWEYVDGSINFSRYVTRVYTLNIFPGTSTQNASVGKTGSAGGTTGGATGGAAGTPSGGGAFSSASTSNLSSSIDAWSTIDAQIAAMISPGGKYSVSTPTGVIVVTDTKEAQSRIAKVIKRIDRLMNQQIALKVTVASVNESNSAGAGINWTAVWSNLAKVAPNYSAKFSGIPMPASIAGGGSAGVSFVAPAGGGQAGVWDGSSILFQALATEANASMVSNNTLMTLNKQPTSVSIATQTGYIQSTTNVVGTAGTPGSTGTTVSTLTTGFILNMTPSVEDDNDIALQFSLDISTPPTMQTLNGVMIPTFNGTQIAQRARIREGETLVLSGFSLRNINGGQQGMFTPGSMWSGGNRTSNYQNQDLVIMITPVLE